eukprot:4625460-Lingulodinium_polyedra.AAC.1
MRPLRHFSPASGVGVGDRASDVAMGPCEVGPKCTNQEYAEPAPPLEADHCSGREAVDDAVGVVSGGDS